MTHTPWRVSTGGAFHTDTGPFLEDATGMLTGRIFSGDDFSIAESVVRAVNNHYRLLEALERTVEWGQSPEETERLARDASEEARK